MKLLFAAVLLLLMSACSDDSDVKVKQEVIPTTYTQVMADYSSNSLAADDKYKDKLVKFPATFQSVTKGIGGDTVYAQSGGEAILAIFESSSEPVLKKLKSGDLFTMACKVALSGAILNDCIAS